MFEKALADAPSMDDLDVERALVPGNPAEILVEESHGANLLVVGSHGREAFRGMLMGSVSIHCVNQGHCPVLVVRDQGLTRRAIGNGRGGPDLRDPARPARRHVYVSAEGCVQLHRRLASTSSTAAWTLSCDMVLPRPSSRSPG